jgi:hypothetical protein
MHLTHARRTAATIAAALSLILILPAPPASAITVGLTGGTFTGAGNSFSLLTPAGAPCSQKPSNLDITFTGNATNGTWSLTGGFSTQFQLGTPPAGQWYQADFTFLSGSGTYAQNSAGPPTWGYTLTSSAPNHVILRLRIYEVTPCDKSVLKCIITVRMSFGGPMTTTAALPGYVPGSIDPLDGFSQGPAHMATSSCSAPFTAWGGQTASIIGMGLL